MVSVHRVVVFTVLHAMQMQSSDEKADCLFVCLSVHLSKVCIVTKRTKNLSRFLYHFEKKNGRWGATPSMGNFGSTGPIGAKSPIFNRYLLVVPQS